MKLLMSVIVGAALFLSGVSPSYAALPAEAKEFNSAFEAVTKIEQPGAKKNSRTTKPAHERERLQAAQLKKLWDIMDGLVIELLNSQKTPEDIQGIFSQLPGYEEPRSVPKTIIGNAVFSDGVDREYPNYWITPVERDGAIHLLGVYNDNLYPGGSLASRLSVYTRKNAGWAKTDAFEGKSTFCPYISPLLHQGNVLMTIEQYVGADRVEGNCKFWKLEAGGKLRLLVRYDELLDYGVYREADKLTIAYTKFPKHLYESVLGTRIRYSIDVVFDKHDSQHKVTCLNPWIEVLNDYFGCLSHGDTQRAKACLKAPELLPLLRKGSTITREAGDIDLGNGVVEMDDGKRVLFQRNKSSRWVIIDVLQR